MKHGFAKTRNFTNLLLAALFAFTATVPALLSMHNIGAAQITERSIAMGSSKMSETDVTYTIDFMPATTGNIEAVVIDFCTGPLVGTICTPVPGFDTNEANIAVSGTNGFSGHTFVVDQTESTANKLVIKDAAGPSVAAGTQSTITVGTSAANDGFTNPSGLGTFYARIITYAVDTNADAYDSTLTGATNPGTAVDSGGIALSTASQLSVSARVQEQIEFCVAALTTAELGTATNCGGDGFSSPVTEVDLGVIDTTALATSPATTTNGGNDRTGAMIVRTNAFNGASVSYFAEQDNGSGRLKVPGVACSGATSGGTVFDDAGSGVTDQCFNSSSTAIDFTDVNEAGEKFGANINAITDLGTTTTQLNPVAAYDGRTANANLYAWQEDGSAVTLASSNSVLDYTLLELEFAAQTAATTPTGTYNVTSTYVATATF